MVRSLVATFTLHFICIGPQVHMLLGIFVNVGWFLEFENVLTVCKIEMLWVYNAIPYDLNLCWLYFGMTFQTSKYIV